MTVSDVNTTSASVLFPEIVNFAVTTAARQLSITSQRLLAIAVVRDARAKDQVY